MENTTSAPTNKKNFLPIITLLLLLIVLPVALILSRQQQETRKRADEPAPVQKCHLCHPEASEPQCSADPNPFEEEYWTTLEDVESPQLAAVKTQAGEEAENPVFIKWVCPPGYKAVRGTVTSPELLPTPTAITPTPGQPTPTPIPSLLCGFVNTNTASADSKTRSWYDPNGKVQGYIRCDNLFHIQQKGVGTNIVKNIQVEFDNQLVE